MIQRLENFVELLLQEPDIRVKTATMLLLYSGLRCGELCGLEWKDIDTKSQTIHITRASQYQRKQGIVAVPTKAKAVCVLSNCRFLYLSC